jgi:hypothetical protein
MSGPFILFAVSMFFAVLSVGYWAYKQAGQRVILPLMVIVAWAAIMVIEAHRT